MRLRLKLLLLFLALVVAPAIGMIFVLYKSMARMQEEVAVQHLEETISQTAHTVDEFIRTRGEDLRVVSLSPMFYQATDAEISDYLTARVKFFPYYKAFYHADTNGVTVAASATNVIGQSIYAVCPGLEEEIRSALSSAPDKLFASGLKDGAIRFCSGTADRAGQTEGVIVGVVEASFLTALMNTLNEKGIGDEHAIVSPTGAILLTVDPDRQKLSIDPDFVVKPVQEALARAATGSARLMDGDGRAEFAGFARLQPFGDNKVGSDYLFVSAPYDAVVAPVRGRFISTGAAAGGIVALAVVLMALFLRGFRVRVENLAQAARLFGQGDFQSRIAAQSRDEIGDVARAFNQMAEQIEKNTEKMRLQQAALNSAVNGVAITNLRGVIQWINPAFTTLTGYSAAEAVGQNPRVLKSGKHPESFYTEMWQTISRGEAWRGELINRRKDGTFYDEEMTITPVRNADEAITHFIAVKQDISERKRAEQELCATHAQLEQMLEHSPVITYRHRLAGETLIPGNASSNFERLIGYTTADAMNMEWWRGHVHREDLGRASAGLNEVLGRGESRVEYRVRHQAGHYLWIEDTARLLRDGAGQPSGIVGVWMDITQRKVAETEVAERARTLALAADVGSALTRGQSLPDMLQGCAAAMVQHLDAAFARIWTLNEQTNVLELRASAGMYTHLDGPHGRVPVGKFKIGLIAQERKPHLTNQVVGDPRVGDQEWAKREGMVAFAGYPLTVNDRVVGVMAFFARRPLPESTLQAMSAIADGIAVGIERMRNHTTLVESKERMRLQTAALESTANGVAITDRRGTIQWVNPAFMALTGYSAEEVVGQNPRVLKSGQHPDSFYAEMWRNVSKGQVWKGEIINRHKSGRLYHEEMTITPVCDALGAITHFVAVKQDISERKRAEIALRNSAERLALATESAGIGIWNYDLQTNALLWDKRMIALYGFRPEGFSGAYEAWERGVHPADLPAARTALQDAISGKKDFHTQFRVAWPDGQIRFIEAHAMVQRAPDGSPLSMTGVNWDITERKMAEAALEEMHKKLVDASREAGMAVIATSVLHNVGNVLNSVNVSADRVSEKVKRLRPASLGKVAALLQDHTHDLPDFLAHDPQGRELPRYLNVLLEQLAEPHKDILPEVVSLKKNVEHIREIVTMQQNYARVPELQETIALSDLAEDAIRINSAGFTRHEVELIRDYSPVPAFPVEKHKVLQILVNLLSNAKYALEASHRRDRKLTVRIGGNGNHSVKISVIDNGVGIAADDLPRIFQHGFTTRATGHGFGLHSGILAAQEMGASLTAFSEGHEKGATFTLELPCQNRERQL